MDRSRFLEARLAAAGVGPGDRVGLSHPRSVDAIAGLIAIHRRGAAYVPLDPTYPRARNLAVAEDAELTAILAPPEVETSLPLGSWRVVTGREPEPAEEEGRPVESAPGDPAYLLYTSGSTGRPKGVVVEHENLRRSTAARIQFYRERGLKAGRFLLLPSLAFDSSVAGLFWALAIGETLVLPEDHEAADPRALAGRIAEAGVTSLLCVPSLWNAMLGAAAAGELDSLELVIVAGEPCPWSLVEEHFRRCPSVRLFNEYGPTEATVWATAAEITPADLPSAGCDRSVPIGTPIPGVRVEVVDPRGQPLPPGVPGEAVVVGPTVASGYWRRPEATAERFSGDGHQRCYRTGDRVVRTGEGDLLFLGRTDDQIKLRGFRIEPGEVEAALLAWPDLEGAVVTVVDDRLEAFVEGEVPSDWREDLVRRLPLHLVPARVTILSKLPRLPNGKIDRRRVAEGKDGGKEVPMPRDDSRSLRDVPTDRELTLLSLWQGLLGAPALGLDDNVFELGAHSLLVAEMAGAVERDLGVRLTGPDVFQNPTVRGLARWIDDPRTEGTADREPYHHLFPLQPSGSGTPFLVGIPHFFADLFASRFRGERPVYGLRGVGLRPEGNLGRWSSMEHLGEEMVTEIRRRFPEAVAPSGHGVHLAGYSFGASMAAEVAFRLEQAGTRVRSLHLITPMPLNVLRWGPLSLELRGLERPLPEVGAAEVLGVLARSWNPLSLRPYRSVWRWLRVQPLRRLLCFLGRRRRRRGRPLTPAILHADVRHERFRLHRRFRPGVVHAPTVILEAEEDVHSPGTSAAGTWRDRFAGSLEVVPTPDPHGDAAAVEETREILLRSLREVSDR